jgi:GT2 family glycosyltransferase
MLWHEETSPRCNQGPGPRILALVDVRDAEQGAARETLVNLSTEGFPALLIGTDHGQTLADAVNRIDWNETSWLMPIKAGDTLASAAAQTYKAAIAGADVQIAYADDDLTTRPGRRTAPHFKPDWNSEMFRYFDYLTGACILQVNREELQALSEMSDWAEQLIALKVRKSAPLHVKKVLHHRRVRPSPQVPTVINVMEEALPSVTIIVPTRNRVDLLRKCLNGIASTKYRDIDVIVVDNDSTDPETISFLKNLDPAFYRVLPYQGAFNYSAINNRAVEVAQGQLLCLLNNDIEIIEPYWLATMAVQAVRSEVGAVGARLLYPDGRIQHAGVVIGMGNAAGHAHRLTADGDEGYFKRHLLPQFTSAVTAACLVVSRERFIAVGGLDERNFAVAFNDVDLCMRLNQRGWQSLYEPRATLIHHESLSRGFDRDPIGAERFAGELAALKQIWSTEYAVDPYHHPELSRASEHFVARL